MQGNPITWEGRRAFITGAAGFSGAHLCNELVRAGAAVSGMDRLEPDLNYVCDCFQGELSDRDRLDSLLFAARPDVIFHLAGLLKSDEPSLFHSVNAGGTKALLEAVIHTGEKPRVVLISSSAVYGEPGEPVPIDEEQKLRPITVYGQSKLDQELIGRDYFENHDVPIVICRPFNLVGPGLSDAMVLSSFARQFVCAERGERDAVLVGNLNPRRDFLDVRDAVRAYRLLAERGIPGDCYNICSGRSISIRACLDILISLCHVRPTIVSDPDRSPREEVFAQVGDPAKINALTGWEPVIEIEQSLLDMLEYWRLRDDACS